MAENTKIQWAHHTANFWIGCTEVSPECDNCYARDLAKRYGWAEWGNDKERHQTKITRSKLESWNRKAVAAGERHRVFVNSLSDVCDTFAPPQWRENISDCARHTLSLDYLLLTKRPQNFRQMFPLPLSNMWGGTTVGVRKSLARIKHLQDTDFKVRFLSIEPLLEDLGTLDLRGIHWVIVGGESGSRSRPCDLGWIRSILDQCKVAGTACFVKQLGAKPQPTTADYAHASERWPNTRLAGNRIFLKDKKGGDISEFPEDLCIRQFPNLKAEAA